jgi:hypothetical protein
MNRIQFFVLTGLSGLVTILLIAHIFLVRQTNYEQNRLALASQAVNQGQAFGTNLQKLAVRILQVSQKTADPGLQELLTRNQINYTPNSESNSSESPTPSTSTTPATH